MGGASDGAAKEDTIPKPDGLEQPGAGLQIERETNKAGRCPALIERADGAKMQRARERMEAARKESEKAEAVAGEKQP